MKKLRKLTALVAFALVIPVCSYGMTDNNKNEEASANAVYNNYSLNEQAGTSSFGLLQSAKEKTYSLYAGYSGNFKNSGRDQEKNNKYNHILEIGGAYTKQQPANWGYSLYIANEFMFNSKNFKIGPKAGANINYSIIMLGAELIGYTDFIHAKGYLKPYVGVGVGPLKISAGYNIELANKATFKDINSFTVGVTIPLYWGK